MDTEDIDAYEAEITAMNSSQALAASSANTPSGTCKTGQSCMGCFSGAMLAYMGLLLFNNSIVTIAMMVP